MSRGPYATPYPFAQAELDQIVRDGTGAGLEASLRNTMKQAHARAMAIVDKATVEDRDLTADENRQCKSLTRAYDEAEDKADAIASGNFELPSAGRQVRPETPQASGGEYRGERDFVAPRGRGTPWNKLFPGARRDNGGFENFGDFAKAIITRDPRLFQNSAGMSEGVGVDGGFSVPPQFISGFADASLQAESIRPRATVIPCSSSELTLPLFDTSDRTSTIAGLDGSQTGEGTAASNQKAKMVSVTLAPKKFVVLVPSTMELLSDAPDVFTSMLQKYMGEALAARLDYAFLTGAGAGQPLGILNAPATVSVAKETAQPTATIVPANVAKMIARLAPGSWNNAVFLVNPSALAQLFQMVTVVSNRAGTENVGGGQVNYFQVLDDGTYSLFGRPVVVTDRCAALGTVGDIILADLTQYAIALRQDATLAISPHVGFTTSEIYFRLSMRIDGQPLLKTAITPRGGGTTLSPFVTLASRP